MTNISHPISARQNSNRPVQKWEYCTLSGNWGSAGSIIYYRGAEPQLQNIDRELGGYNLAVAKLGADGWEVVGPHGENVLIFKRPIQ